MKICPVGATLFRVNGRTDRQRDMIKPVISFYNFAKAHKNINFVNKL